MKANYIKTMDFTFEDVEILDVKNEKELLDKFKEAEVIKILNGKETEYIHSSYIMYFGLRDEL